MYAWIDRERERYISTIHIYIYIYIYVYTHTGSQDSPTRKMSFREDEAGRDRQSGFCWLR